MLISEAYQRENPRKIVYEYIMYDWGVPISWIHKTGNSVTLSFIINGIRVFIFNNLVGSVDLILEMSVTISIDSTNIQLIQRQKPLNLDQYNQ